MNTKIRKGLIVNTIVGGIFFLLLFIFFSFDKANSIGFLSRDLTNNNKILGTLVPALIIILLVLSLIAFTLNTLFIFFKDSNENVVSKISDTCNTLNIVPIVLSIFFLIDAFFFSPVRVSGLSMNNTLNDNDILIISRTYKTINNSDIIVIEKENGDFIIKRVIAVEGDIIDVDDSGKVYVNNVLVESSENWRGGKAIKYSNRKLEKGEFYVLGDNRNNSSDSRYYGIFKKEQIIGKAVLSIVPLKKDLSPDILYK